MNKVKRIVLVIVFSLLSVIVLIDTILVITLCQTINNMMDYPETYFPAMEKSSIYVKIDDVGYIRYDEVGLDPAKIESGDIKVYTSEEIFNITNEALAKRDGLNNDTGSSN